MARTSDRPPSRFPHVVLLLACWATGIYPAQAPTTPERISLTYELHNVTISYEWQPPAVDSENSLGALSAVVRAPGHPAATFQLSPLLIAPANPLRFVESRRTADEHEKKLGFLVNGASVTVTVRLRGTSGALLIDFAADKPLIAGLHIAEFSAASRPIKLHVPYYSGTPLYFDAPGVFANAYYVPSQSNATQLGSSDATYQVLTDGRRNLLRETFAVSISNRFADVLPSIQNPPSPYRKQLAGRTVIDIWNQSNFDQITQALTALGNAGLKNCVILVHNWQQNGYDNGLPSQYPANAAQGGNSGLNKAFNIGRRLGCYVGLHENYVDYYPNTTGFNKNAIALSNDGSLMRAWFNPATKMQAYATRQAWVLKNATTESPQIHSGLNTNATFIDVNSASEPWFHIDMDATQPGAGMFSAVAKTSENLWNYERQTHGGPVFGEGGNHWYWSGLLDGVEAQFGAGLDTRAERNPLFVDFDLLKIHPLQVNHGMGMYERWLAPGESITQGGLLDAYRMQEIIYGHAPYIGGNLWTNADRVLQEQNLVSPVAERYGFQTPSLISYQVNGIWTDSNAAIKAADWSRVAVKYGNGDKLIANAQSQTLDVDGFHIPQYGWIAQGAGLLAYTALRDGMITDYAQTSTSFFANARNQADLLASGTIAKPSVQSFTQTGVRSARYQMQWQVLDGPQGANLTDFLHFVDKSGNLAFQSDYPLSVPASQWKPGHLVVNTLNLQIPANLPDGVYSMRAGLYSVLTGLRVPNLGVDDGTQRYILGAVVVSNNGQSIAFQPQSLPAPPGDARLNSRGATVNFSTIQTDGMVSLSLNQGVWTLQAYPRYRNVRVELSTSQFPVPSRATCDAAPVKPLVANGYWQLPVNGAQSCTWSK